MAKQPNPAPGGFVPFSAPVVDQTVGFTPIAVTPVPTFSPEPQEAPQPAAKAEKEA